MITPLLDPTLVMAGTCLVGLIVVAAALLKAWQGWLELKRQELGQTSRRSQGTYPQARSECQWSGAVSRASDTATQAGIGLGTAIAVAISWSVNQSILWAIIHGFFGWFYVIWHAFTRPGGLMG